MGRQWLHAKRLVAGLKKGRQTSKVVREISVAAKLGGADPAMNARLFAAVEKARKESVARDVIESGKSVLLVGRSSLARESPAPQRRVDLSDHRAIGRQAPTVERPEMHVVFDVLPDVAQPRNACVRGLRYRPLHVEMEH